MNENKQHKSKRGRFATFSLVLRYLLNSFMTALKMVSGRFFALIYYSSYPNSSSGGEFGPLIS